jgi:hypothetical protein
VRSSHFDTKDTLAARFKEMTTTCNPVIHRCTEAQVDGICQEMQRASDQGLQRLKHLEQQLDEQQQQQLDEHDTSTLLQVVEEAKVVKGSRMFELYIPQLGDTTKLSLSYACYQRLFNLYTKPTREQLIADVWLLVYRYITMLGGDIRRFEGTSLQTSMAPQTFQCLARRFGVAGECFASPLNCYFGTRYYSAFDDIDKSFGSSGSFFGMSEKQGSFQANPPFCEELMLAMVEHMEKLLSETTLYVAHKHKHNTNRESERATERESDRATENDRPMTSCTDTCCASVDQCRLHSSCRIGLNLRPRQASAFEPVASSVVRRRSIQPSICWLHTKYRRTRVKYRTIQYTQHACRSFRTMRVSNLGRQHHRNYSNYRYTCSRDTAQVIVIVIVVRDRCLVNKRSCNSFELRRIESALR